VTTRRTAPIRMLLIVSAVGVLAGTLAETPSKADSIGQLSSQLSEQQAQQQSLSGSISKLSRLIGSLDSQIALVESREAAVRAELAQDRIELERVRAALRRERALIVVLKARLALSRKILARQLVSTYETDRPDLITVVLDSNGFNDLLENIDFLTRAKRQQQSVIRATSEAKERADSAERRLAQLERTKLEITNAAATRARALAGMNLLLHSRQAALSRARAAKQAALRASRAKGQQLQAAISRIRAAQAAAARAASSTPTSTGPALGPSGGWAIPYSIVLCESGGQNVTPNSAGASGYYQIIPSTWKLYGGTGPAAYLASKAEQDAVASRIWNGGAGASAWVCAGIVGIR